METVVYDSWRRFLILSVTDTPKMYLYTFRRSSKYLLKRFSFQVKFCVYIYDLRGPVYTYSDSSRFLEDSYYDHQREIHDLRITLWCWICVLVIRGSCRPSSGCDHSIIVIKWLKRDSHVSYRTCSSSHDSLLIHLVVMIGGQSELR